MVDVIHVSTGITGISGQWCCWNVVEPNSESTSETALKGGNQLIYCKTNNNEISFFLFKKWNIYICKFCHCSFIIKDFKSLNWIQSELHHTGALPPASLDWCGMQEQIMGYLCLRGVSIPVTCTYYLFSIIWSPPFYSSYTWYFSTSLIVSLCYSLLYSDCGADTWHRNLLWDK